MFSSEKSKHTARHSGFLIQKPVIFLSCLCAFLFICSLISCSRFFPQLPESSGVLAEPVNGLTSAQMDLHLRGDEAFAEVFGVEEGLGPVFIGTSCEGCHAGDGRGHPLMSFQRFGVWDGSSFDPLTYRGGPQLQHRAIPGFEPEVFPTEASGSVELIAPPVTGLGFLENVPDSVLIALADPNDNNADGISGRLNYVNPPDFFVPAAHHIPSGGKYIGRFGRKANAIDLLQQTANAYLNDIGITSDFNPADLVNVQVSSAASDDVPDPEVFASTVHEVVFYLRTLKAPPRRNQNDPEVVEGELLFSQSGCASCHTPQLVTGPSEISALNEVTFFPYSDLLLHDMGSGLDGGYAEGSGTPPEWRTAPLWGIGLSSDSQGSQEFFLHDGRAKTLDEAITNHGGEAANSLSAYLGLSTAEQQKIIAFLKSL